jgi:diaminopimelate epimerase
MRFHKYHGCGNDFVMIEDLDGRLGPPESLPHALVAALCDRRKGVGADGVVRIIGREGDPSTASAGATFRLDYYNAEGAPAGMCGNGIRCLAALEKRAGRFEGEQLVNSGSRVVAVSALSEGTFRVDMGEPSFDRAAVPMTGTGPALRADVSLDGEMLTGTGVSMGNPHLVLFLSDIDREMTDEVVHTLGSRLERHPDFPERTNVEFVDVVSPTELRMRVWERGIGETQACGSGACAVAVAAAALERTGPHVIVAQPGGELEIDWTEGGRVWLTGPAEEVFEGEVDAAWLEARGLQRFGELVREIARVTSSSAPSGADELAVK